MTYLTKSITDNRYLFIILIFIILAYEILTKINVDDWIQATSHAEISNEAEQHSTYYNSKSTLG